MYIRMSHCTKHSARSRCKSMDTLLNRGTCHQACAKKGKLIKNQRNTIACSRKEMLVTAANCRLILTRIPTKKQCYLLGLVREVYSP